MSTYAIEFKIIYQSTTRKLTLAQKPTYAQFVSLIQTRFNLSDPTTIAFTYVDSEKDIITLSSQEEFEDLLELDNNSNPDHREPYTLSLQTTTPTLNLNPEVLDEFKILRDVENGLALFNLSFTHRIRELVGDGSWEHEGRRGEERAHHHHPHHHHHQGRGRGGRGRGRGGDERGRGRSGRGDHKGGPWEMRNQEAEEDDDEEERETENQDDEEENIEAAGGFEGGSPKVRHHPHPSHLGRRGHQAPPFHTHRFDAGPHFSLHDLHHSYYAPSPPPHHHQQHPNFQFHHHYGPHHAGPSSSHPLAQHEEEHHNTHHHYHSGRRGGGHNFGGFFGAGRGGSRDF